jgi:hypothetical protein
MTKFLGNLALSVLAVVAVFVGTGPACAGIIFDNGAPDQSNGIDMSAWIQSDPFTLSSSGVVTGINFWDFEQKNAYLGNISWAIAATNPDKTPGSILESGTVAPNRLATGVILNFSGQIYNEYENSFSISPFNAAAHVTYALELHNGSTLTSPTARQEYYWENGNRHAPPFGYDFYLPINFGWDSNGGSLAFQLVGETGGTNVPEPSAFVLFTIGATCLAVGARFRRKTA